MADTTGGGPVPRSGIIEVSTCRLKVGEGRWPFADANRAAIAAHWHRRRSQSPALFNGSVLSLLEQHVAADTFFATFARSEFASYLYWREQGFPDDTVRDGFGSALLLSADGALLLGRQSPGNLNAGFIYPPGGFIDRRDVRGDGTIDIDGSIARELAEETGLEPALLERQPGYLVTFSGPLVAIAARYRAPLPAVELRRRILDHMARERKPELADIVIVRGRADIDPERMIDYVQQLVRHILG